MDDAELLEALRETTARLIDESRQLRAHSEQLIARSQHLRLKAFTDEGELALPASKRSGAAKRKRARARHAATLNAVAAVQGIALDAAEGDQIARGQLLRLLPHFHAMLQPTPHEAKQGGQGPILPQFNRPPNRTAESPSPSTSIAPAYERPTVIGPDGTEYVEP